MDVNVVLINRSTDEARRFAKLFSRRSYTNFMERSVTLASATRTEIQKDFDTIQFVYVQVVNESDDDPADVYVYKNLSPEYWEVGHAFVAFDCDISQLHLMAPSGATVYLYLGGE